MAAFLILNSRLNILPFFLAECSPLTFYRAFPHIFSLFTLMLTTEISFILLQVTWVFFET